MFVAKVTICACSNERPLRKRTLVRVLRDHGEDCKALLERGLVHEFVVRSLLWHPHPIQPSDVSFLIAFSTLAAIWDVTQDVDWSMSGFSSMTIALAPTRSPACVPTYASHVVVLALMVHFVLVARIQWTVDEAKDTCEISAGRKR